MTGARERHLESILQPTLRQIILVQDFPRTLIQVTLQITGTPEDETSTTKLNQAYSVCQVASCSSLAPKILTVDV
jgi:exosome complex component RRP46